MIGIPSPAKCYVGFIEHINLVKQCTVASDKSQKLCNNVVEISFVSLFSFSTTKIFRFFSRILLNKKGDGNLLKEVLLSSY